MKTHARQIKKNAEETNSETITAKPNTRENKPNTKEFKYGPLPTFPKQRLWTRGVMIIGIFIIVYFSSKKSREVAFAKQKDVHEQRGQYVPCSDGIKSELLKYPGCAPEKCGRLVTDKLVSSLEANTLLGIAKKGFALGGSDGGASILDLHSGALSQGTSFINMYMLDETRDLFKNSEFEVYRTVKTNIQRSIAFQFGIDFNALYLTHPTFFSRLTNAPARTVHDEYWHPHVDKETYESFHYTSLVYLSDYSKDFEGGRFVFIDKDNTNRTVEPRKGRVSMFTSGSENLHFVEPVTNGIRYAITVSFTCNEKFGITDPTGAAIVK